MDKKRIVVTLEGPMARNLDRLRREIVVMGKFSDADIIRSALKQVYRDYKYQKDVKDMELV